MNGFRLASLPIRLAVIIGFALAMSHQLWWLAGLIIALALVMGFAGLWGSRR